MSRMFWVAALVAGLWAAPALAAFGPNYKVYPNPVRVDRGQRAVKFEDFTGGGELKIYNAAGRLVFERTFDASVTTFDWELRNNDNKDVAAGVYIWHLTTTGEDRTGKIGVIR